MIRDKIYVCGIIKKKSQSVLTQLPKSLWLKKKNQECETHCDQNIDFAIRYLDNSVSGTSYLWQTTSVCSFRSTLFLPPSYCQLQEADLNGILGQALYCLISSQFSQWQPQQEIRKKEENEDGICVTLVLSSKSCLRLTLPFKYKLYVFLGDLWYMILSLQVHVTISSPSRFRPKLPAPGDCSIPCLFGNPACTFVIVPVLTPL